MFHVYNEQFQKALNTMSLFKILFGAIQIIHDTFSALFRPPPAPPPLCDTFYQPLLVKFPIKIVL